MITMDLLTSSAADIVTQIKKGYVSTEEYIAKIFDHIKKVESNVHAYISLNDLAIERAREVDSAVKRGEKLGKLAGIAIAVKDNICTSNMKTTCASKILEHIFPHTTQLL